MASSQLERSTPEATAPAPMRSVYRPESTSTSMRASRLRYIEYASVVTV